MFRKFLDYIFKYKGNMALVLSVVAGITTIDLIQFKIKKNTI